LDEYPCLPGDEGRVKRCAQFAAINGCRGGIPPRAGAFPDLRGSRNEGGVLRGPSRIRIHHSLAGDPANWTSARGSGTNNAGPRRACERTAAGIHRGCRPGGSKRGRKGPCLQVASHGRKVTSGPALPPHPKAARGDADQRFESGRRVLTTSRSTWRHQTTSEGCWRWKTA